MKTNKDKVPRNRKEYCLKNKNKISEYHKEYQLKNRIKLSEYRKEYCLKNKNKISEYHKEYNLKNKDKKKKYRQTNKIKMSEYLKEYRQKNKIKRSEYIKEYFQTNKDKLVKMRTVRNKKRYRTNTEYRLSNIIGNNFRNFLKRMRQNKQQRTFDYFNYDMNMLKIRLESTFSPEMNWHNCGTYWHVDHIIPVSYFVCKSKTTNDGDKKANLIKECWALSNLQALEGTENIKKGDKLPDGSRARYWKE